MKFTFNPFTDDLDLINTIEKVTVDPAIGGDMDLIFNTVDKKLKMYYDGTWYVLNTLTIPDNFILETGDNILLENGDRILLEV